MISRWLPFRYEWSRAAKSLKGVQITHAKPMPVRCEHCGWKSCVVKSVNNRSNSSSMINQGPEEAFFAQFRWFNLKDDRSTHRTRPLEWRDNGSNPYNVTLVLDIVQQLLDAEPVNHQHTWITVLANTPSVRLARLGDPDGSVTLRVQGTPYDHLVCRCLMPLCLSLCGLSA